MPDRWCAATSWSSRAIRARSETTAASARSRCARTASAARSRSSVLLRRRAAAYTPMKAAAVNITAFELRWFATTVSMSSSPRLTAAAAAVWTSTAAATTAIVSQSVAMVPTV